MKSREKDFNLYDLILLLFVICSLTWRQKQEYSLETLFGFISATVDFY